MSQTDKNLPTSQHSPIPMRPSAAPMVPDYEFLAWLFNMRLMEEISTPPEAYCLDQLLRPQSHETASQIAALFETETWCKIEDRKRANGLRVAARQIPLNRVDLVALYDPGRVDLVPLCDPPKSFLRRMNEGIRTMALDLAARLDISAGGGHLTTALPSALFKRSLRRKVLGAILSLIDGRPDIPLKLVTITCRTWDFPMSSFMFPVHGDPARQLKTDLTVAGVSDSSGFLIAYPEIEFGPANDGFKIYFHGIVTGAKITALQRLLKADGYDPASISYQPFTTGSMPHTRIQLAAALSRFWPQQTWGTFGYHLKPEQHAVQTPLQTVNQLLYLKWLEHKAVSDTFVLDGLHISERRLIPMCL
jgi:hypothetical protein